MARTITVDQYKLLLLTIVLSIISCWILQEIMERIFNMAPNITTKQNLREIADSKADSTAYYEINKRLTKSLDINGEFRIQPRPAVHFIKSMWQLILFIFSLWVYITDWQWFMDHFIDLKQDSVYFMPLLHINASMIGVYAWEICSNRYGKLSWPLLIHHCCSIAVGLSISMGTYIPFGTWYGFCLVAMSFPNTFAFGFRARYSNQYPDFTRKLFVFSYCWLLFTIALNLSGQLFLFCNSLIYHYDESIHIAIIMIFCMAAFLYDDIHLLKAFHVYSRQHYEDADIFMVSTDVTEQLQRQPLL